MSLPPRIGEKEKKRALPPREKESEENKTHKETKALPPRPPKCTTIKDSQIFWEKMDNLFFETIGQAKKAFRINSYINIIIVIVGCALLGYSMLYSWIKGFDLYSTAFGTLGVVSFIATFFVQPQNLVQKNVGDLTQIQMCYRTYCIQWETVVDWERNNEKTMKIEDIEKINRHILDITKELSQHVETMIGKTK